MVWIGYNEKLPKLLELVSNRMVDLQVDPDRFQLVHERLLRHYRNFALEQPYQHALYHHVRPSLLSKLLTSCVCVCVRLL